MSKIVAIEHLCTVKKFGMLTPTTFEIGFDTALPLDFVAGQFISVVIPGAGPGGRDLRRAYSIASTPEMRPIELCIKLVEEGPGTNFLYKLKPGDTFKGFAPYGDFVYKPKPSRHICFIATGTGVAPFRAIMQSKHFRANLPESATCMMGIRYENELLYDDELSKIPRLRWVPVVSQPSSDWTGFRGRVTDYLRTVAQDFPWNQTDYYLCGNGGMITEVKSILAEKGVGKESIHQEVYYK